MRSRASKAVAVLSVLSLVLAAAAIALWVRSYFVGEAIVYASRLSDDSGDWLTAPTRLYAIASTRGVLALSVERQPGGAITLGRFGWRYERWQPESGSGPRPSAEDAVNVSFLGFCDSCYRKLR